MLTRMSRLLTEHFSASYLKSPDNLNLLSVVLARLKDIRWHLATVSPSTFIIHNDKNSRPETSLPLNDPKKLLPHFFGDTKLYWGMGVLLYDDLKQQNMYAPTTSCLGVYFGVLFDIPFIVFTYSFLFLTLCYVSTLVTCTRLQHPLHHPLSLTMYHAHPHYTGFMEICMHFRVRRLPCGMPMHLSVT